MIGWSSSPHCGCLAATCLMCLQAMRDVVTRCLQKDPRNRPTASQLLEHKFFKVSPCAAYASGLAAAAVVAEPLHQRQKSSAAFAITHCTMLSFVLRGCSKRAMRSTWLGTSWRTCHHWATGCSRSGRARRQRLVRTTSATLRAPRCVTCTGCLCMCSRASHLRCAGPRHQHGVEQHSALHIPGLYRRSTSRV